MELGKMLMVMLGAKKAVHEMRQILKDEEEEDNMEIVISREVLLGWYRKFEGLIMLTEKFHVD